jgi:magnesium chelatase family protein
LDRIDLHVEVPAVPFRDISSECKGESSTLMVKRVNEARLRQYQRFAQKKKIRNNAALSGSHFKPLVLLEFAVVLIMLHSWLPVLLPSL